MFNSIKFRVTVYISLCFLLLLSLFGYFSYKSIEKDLKKKHFEESELVLENKAAIFQSLFEPAQNALYEVTESNGSVFPSAAVSTSLLNSVKLLKQTIPDSKAIHVGLADGRVFSSLKNESESAYPTLEEVWYREAQSNTGESVWTGPSLLSSGEESIIRVSRAFSKGAVEGAAAIEFSVENLTQYIDDDSVGERGAVFLLSPDGKKITGHGGSISFEKLFEKDSDTQLNKASDEMTEAWIDDELFYIKSKEITINGMAVVTAISHLDIKESLLETHLPVFLWGLLCAVIFCILTYLGVFRLVRPIKDLASLMEKAETGNYEVYAPEKRYIETAAFSKGFNSMIDSIKKRDEALNASYATLRKAEERLRMQYSELLQSQSELKENDEKIMRLASFDPLTGLMNRRKLLEILDEDIEQRKEKKAVIFIDLDNFKTVNDTQGHSVGDRLLKEVARRFVSLPRSDKLVGRIGGDEFIIAIREAASREEVEEEAKKILQILEEPVMIDKLSYNVTTSIGVALYPHHGSNSEELLKNADMAMYKAKAIGKNGYAVFDDSIQQEMTTKVRIEAGIREALRIDGFNLFFQPLYNLKEKRYTNIEALLRTNHEPLNEFPMDKIIETAEESGLIVSIDKWVLRKAFQYAKEINSSLSEKIKVSVNISAVHIGQKDFVQNVKAALLATGVQPSLIELEITETSVMESFQHNKRKLEELKQLGIHIHLDDFGTGYSSLNYLNNLPIDYVKIDKSFVDSLLDSEKESKVIKAIIDLAHNIGLKVVAEGVEYEEQMRFLESCSCDVVQGYFLSRPISSEDMKELLQKEYEVLHHVRI
ncbi:MAG: bifunctional diguanylate cyclase/phosphodiesterase [Bacillota bacterium]